jgi:anti-sigma regulatory factor (Ser/Thr protein kinase)
MLLNEVRSQVQADEAVNYEIRLVLSELVQNAVLHGKPPVKVSATLCQDCIIFMVEDSGEGFDVSNVCNAFDICGESGRGIRIISSLAEVVSFNESANKVLVRMKIY